MGHADIEMFKAGMRRLAAGVSVITTRHNDVPQGLVATAVTSVSGEPPSLLVCVNRTASAHDAIVSAGFFCVNVLAGDQQPVAALFSSREARDTRFSVDSWITLATGAPVLENALVSFDCRTSNPVHHGSHTIFIATVLAIKLAQGGIDPLLYLDGRYRAVTPLPSP